MKLTLAIVFVVTYERINIGYINSIDYRDENVSRLLRGQTGRFNYNILENVARASRLNKRRERRTLSG